MKKLKVYVAHNYGRRRGLRLEELQANVDASIRIGIELIKKGYIPIIPLLYHYVHRMANESIPESVFIEIGDELVKVCDILLIATPPSDAGSDIYGEIKVAHARNIPIYNSVEELPQR